MSETERFKITSETFQLPKPQFKFSKRWAIGSFISAIALVDASTKWGYLRMINQTPLPFMEYFNQYLLGNSGLIIPLSLLIAASSGLTIGFAKRRS